MSHIFEKFSISTEKPGISIKKKHSIWIKISHQFLFGHYGNLVWYKDNNIFTANPVFLNHWRRVSNTLRLFINKLLQFFFRSRKLRKRTKRLITEVHRVQQIMRKETNSNK